MKHYIIFTFFSMAFATMTLAQEAKPATTGKSFYLAASVGPSFPVGDYSTTKDINSGFAKIGYNVNLNFGYNITNRLGIASTAFYGFNKLNEKAINDNLNNGGPTVGSVGVDHWQYHGIVVGPMTTFDLADKVYLDLKALGGIASANFPVFKSGSSSSPEKWKTAFALRLGGDIRYNFNSQFTFFSSIDYNFMKPKWKFTETVDNQTIRVDVAQRMETLNINLGVGYIF
jgi:hypothetical protein